MTLGRKTLRIAFAACNKNVKLHAQDPAYIYRCDNLAHALQVAGHTVWQGHARDLPWTQAWDVVVFHRPRAQWWIRAKVVWLQRRGTNCVADFDDLVFEPALAQHSPGVVNGLVPLETTQKQFLSHAQALRWFNAVTVSTQSLAEYARVQVQGAAVSVVPNAVHWSWRRKPLFNQVRNSCTMAYMPGTRSHDRDFALLAPAIERTLETHLHVRLQITGPLKHSLLGRVDQVFQQEKKPFAEFAQVFKGVGLNLAPLIRSPFNDCKSGIKVLEAAWWGIPTVFSHLPDAMRLLGAGALQANTLADFEELLNNWACDPAAFAPEPKELREAVLRHADIDQVAARWIHDVACVPALEVVCAA
jgi:hypothetical protein